MYGDEVQAPRRARSLAAHRPNCRRARVLAVLERVGVPARAAWIHDLAAASGAPLPAHASSGLLLAEEARWRKAAARYDAWIVPALDARGLTALPRLLARSDWEAERRLVGPRSLRVHLLRFLLALLEAGGPTASEEAAGQRQALVRRHAQSVAGALEPGQLVDAARVRRAVRAELDEIEALDREERREAARRLARLDPVFRIWGCPAIVDGGDPRVEGSVVGGLGEGSLQLEPRP